MNLVASKLFFWSDTHFGHRGILKYTQRPVADLSEMDRWLEALWSTVPRDGILIHLGDLSFLPREETIALVARAPGRTLFVRGNHDKGIGDSSIVEYRFNDPDPRGHALRTGKFVQLDPLTEIKVDGQKLVLCHFPLESWHGMHRGAWHLHGHCHGSLPAFGKRLDVGVDGPLGPGPISFARVKAWMDAREIFSRDHHQPSGLAESSRDVEA